MNSSAIFITSTRCPIRIGLTTRRTGSINTARANLVHSWATDTDDQTVMPRWGKVGKQRIVDEGPLKPFKDMSADHQMWQKGRDAKYDMETFDEVLVEQSKGFMDRAKAAGKPFFIWHNTTRMHVFTYLAQKYQAKMNFQSNFGFEEAGMAQMDDDIGDLLKHLDDIGVADNTIVIFTTDNGAEVFTWPDGGMTPFRATKGTVFEGGFRVPCIARWPGKIKPGTVENGIFSGLDWLPTLVAAPGNPNIVQQVSQGLQLGDRTYKNHLDGYNQTDLLTGRGPSARHEIFISANHNSAQFVSTTSSSSSTSSHSAGRARRSRPTCRPSSICARIRSNGRRQFAAKRSTTRVAGT
jgi:arylsulfatase A-like enzyme